MIELTDLAYAAGYTDGDGCFHIGKYTSNKRIRYRAMFVINSTELENVQWFQKVFGGSISSGTRKKSNHKIIYRYVLKGKLLENFKWIGSFLLEKTWEFCLFWQFQQPIHKDDWDKIIEEMKFVKNNYGLVNADDCNLLNSPELKTVPNENDFAYLAGFIDAECCLNIQRYKPKSSPNFFYKIQLQCNNTKSPTFFWISKIFGGQFYFIDRSKYKRNRNQIAWRISSKSLNKILKEIYPFLKHKKPVCEELINFYKTTLNRKGNPSSNSSTFTEFYKPILEERERIFHKVQSLNKKGI